MLICLRFESREDCGANIAIVKTRKLPLFPLILGLAAAGTISADDGADVVYVPTPHDVVSKMLELAEVTRDDVVYDLGCGDGRIVATAAKRWGCRGVGVDISPVRVKEALEVAEDAGVSDLVEIREESVYDTDLSDATVVMLYLLPSMNRKLVPQLEKMKPGSRIVAHEYEGLDELGIVPDKRVWVTSKEDNTAHLLILWTLPFKKGEE